jgi:hypothetical protein
MSRLLFLLVLGFVGTAAMGIGGASIAKHIGAAIGLAIGLVTTFGGLARVVGR